MVYFSTRRWYTFQLIYTDPRIVRHAIEHRYKEKIIDANVENTNDRLVNDYLEKLIQIPYTLPKLSDSEVETYITLLFCENDLEDPDDFKKVLEAFKTFREKDRYSVFDFSKVKLVVGPLKTDKLEQHVSLIAKLSPIISESLYGNPRQIKRFLNTFMLRKKLAMVANIADFKDDILAKLMILEYAEQRLFETLYNWQLSNKGIATELGKLESICTIKGNEKISFPDELKAWNKAKIINWLCVEPYLSKIDLRDYYWISRDKLSSMQSNLLIPPIVKSLILKLEPDKMAVKITKKILEEELVILSNNQKESFFNLLKQRIIMEPNKNRYYDIFNYSLDMGIDCVAFYIDALISVGKKLPPSVIESIRQLNERYPELNQFIKITPKPKI